MPRVGVTRDKTLPGLGFRGRMAEISKINAVSRCWLRILQYDSQQLHLQSLARYASQNRRPTGPSLSKEEIVRLEDIYGSSYSYEKPSSGRLEQSDARG